MFDILHKIGFAICHQIPERTFFINEQPMPLCSRCTGIYAGIFITLTFYFFTKFVKHKKPSLPPRMFVGLTSIFFILLMLFNAVSPLFNLPTSNLMRFITGMLFGISLPLFLLPAINYSPKSTHDEERIVTGKEYLFVLGIAFVFIVLVAGQSDVVFGVISYLSIIGLLFFILLVNTAIITLILENIRSVKLTPYYYAMLLGAIISGIELYIFSFFHSEIIKNFI